MQARAIATLKCDFPVPVPPTRITLRGGSRKEPSASRRTTGSSTSLSANENPSSSLAVGNRATLSWYLIEWARLSAISAFRSAPR